ncbi:putative wall-associated receptor kinase-like 16 [Senna tora]|uniref:Putative wall-associated receptor kinase-like 16 n=1 Tax=Senna tora TaxID=362788 RepID=A0A834WD93_9FABA|nr:putative wall-associated receptor kinase-like 16 [Senna tora]
MKLIKLWLILLTTVAVGVAEAQSLPGCPDKCGDVDIPYPFGVGVQPGTDQNCFLEDSFSLTCDNSVLLSQNLPISGISLQGSLEMSMSVAPNCYNESGGEISNVPSSLGISAFTISSSANEFISVGCDTYGYLYSFHNNTIYSTGCLTRCSSGDSGCKSYWVQLLEMQFHLKLLCCFLFYLRRLLYDSRSSLKWGLYSVTSVSPSSSVSLAIRQKSAVSFCVDIPLGMRNITSQAYSFNNHAQVWDFNNCSYAFVAKREWFNFSLDFLDYLPYSNTPLVVDWTIPNGTCESAEARSDYACTSNTRCVDSNDGFGYNCRCLDGFEGNPYHPDGCHDVDECVESTHNCTSQENCRNTFGTFECFCPLGYSGNGTSAARCQAPLSKNSLTMVLIGVSVGVVVLCVGLSWMYLVYQKRKLMKLKQKFFRLNGGYVLQQHLSVKETSSQTAKIFTAEELKKATNNYHDSLIIGRGGFGTVYKGCLADNTIVAIKKSKRVDQSQIEQFINEVVVLSQINHRNVVKLLGCCLETEVPLLVYEFVNNGTLFDYIHKENKHSDVSLETRLRIATEAAGALAYLHSAASIPIIHRDVKTSNILLDETYTAKVSDFGASRLVPLDETGQLATMVQGTFGYLDPEYMQKNQLTEKSDVYSFGVVLVEMLTGKKAISFDRSEEERNLAMHFLSYLNRGHLFEIVEVGLVNEENKQRIHEVAVLAARCVRLRGEERPSMKEVAMELEGIRANGKHPWLDRNLNLEETQALIRDGETLGLIENLDSINDRNVGWDSITNHHVLINLDDGR